MAAIAECYVVPEFALGAITDAASPRKRLLGAPRDAFFEIVGANSTETVSYSWAGYVVATLLPYLDERGLKLMKGRHEPLANSLSRQRQAAIFILTDEHQPYLEDLDPDRYSEEELQQFYEAFNEVQADGVGRAMLDGIEMLRQSVSRLRSDSVALLIIG